MDITRIQSVTAYIIISVVMLTSSALFLIPVIRGIDPTPYLGLVKEYGMYHSGILMLVAGYIFAMRWRTATPAEAALEETGPTVLSESDYDDLIDLCANPPEPTPALVNAMERHSRLVESDQNTRGFSDPPIK